MGRTLWSARLASGNSAQIEKGGLSVCSVSPTICGSTQYSTNPRSAWTVAKCCHAEDIPCSTQAVSGKSISPSTTLENNEGQRSIDCIPLSACSEKPFIEESLRASGHQLPAAQDFRWHTPRHIYYYYSSNPLTAANTGLYSIPLAKSVSEARCFLTRCIIQNTFFTSNSAAMVGRIGLGYIAWHLMALLGPRGGPLGLRQSGIRMRRAVE